MDYITLIAGILEGVLSLAADATTGQVSSIITMLDKVIPVATSEARGLLQPVQNIITELSGSGAVTPEQIAALQAQSATIDAALDAAAKDDGLSGV